VAHCPQFRAPRSSAYWRVDYADASACALSGDFTHGGRPYRAVDCHYAARWRARDYSIVAQRDGFDLGVIDDRYFDDLASAGYLAWGIRGFGADRDQFIDWFPAQVMDDQIEAALCQVDGHRLALFTQSDEANFDHATSSLAGSRKGSSSSWRTHASAANSSGSRKTH